jgi:cytochrome P450
VADAAQVRRLLLGEQGARPITATDWTPAVRALLGENSLLMKTGAPHAQSRRILSSAFTTAAVESYLPLVVDATARALAGWADACTPSSTSPTTGRSVRGLAVGKDLAFEVAARALIAGDMDPATMVAFREDFDAFTVGFFGIPVAIPGNAFWRALRARERVLARIDKLIDAEYDAIAAEAAGAAPLRGGTPTALRLLVTATDPETGAAASRDELRDQVALSLFAGHETTGTTIARMLAYLTADRHPAVLAKLRAEQEAVVAKHGPELTPAACAAMPYADATVKELFRLFPIVSGVFRRALVDLDVRFFFLFFF